MNLVIIDKANKKYDHFIHANAEVELLIMNNINRINDKNGTFLTVTMDVDTKKLELLGYVMDQGMHEMLVMEYNENRSSEEPHMPRWVTGL